ncbi:peptide ABC transporter substrate-binding protein [Stackebrandtia soli]|uniref:peptide ABC transporter substrate-binding protein n=1 Tax=Stackebrandtia soli TaxID=1892856 RepID=UPI0039EC1FAC
MRKRLIATVAVAALAVAGCSGGNSDDPASEGIDGGTLRLGMPGEGPPHLSPFLSADTSSGAIVDKIYVGLVRYSAETSEVENLIAKEFTTEDNKTWTVTINDGWTFHNGEEITAQTFVDSWNFTANETNAPDNNQFHSRVVGYEDVKTGKADAMEGLKVVDETTFEVTFSQSWLAFPTAMGYPAYFPLAADCMADAEACDQKPIGNGPMMYPEGDVDKNVEIELTRWDDYKGTKPKVEKVQYKIYTDDVAMWAAYESDEIDMAAAPEAEYTKASTEMADQLLTAQSASFTYAGFPTKVAPFDKKEVRQAFSLAVDRNAVLEAAFQGRHTPATSFTPPTVIPGGIDGTCGYCELDVEKAKELLEEAGGWKEGEVLNLYVNEGVGHEAWMKVVGDQLKKNLGIDYKLNSLTWEDYLKLNTAGDFDGLFRLGWAPDYPLNENYLTGVYGHGPDNGFGYLNEDFEAKLAEGDSAENIEDAIKIYQDAERIVGEDMPNIPMFFSDAHTFIGTNVVKDSVKYGALNGWNWDIVQLKS